MLWAAFVVLLLAWLLGMVASFTLGGLIHALLALAVAVLLLQVIDSENDSRTKKGGRQTGDEQGMRPQDKGAA